METILEGFFCTFPLVWIIVGILLVYLTSSKAQVQMLTGLTEVKRECCGRQKLDYGAALEIEEPDLVWSKESKESGLLGSGENSNSLVDCEKETTHHSVYTQPRSVSMKEYDDKLLRDVCNSESTFYNHIRLRVSKPDWIFIQSVPSLTDSMLKKISSGMLQVEEHTIKVTNKSGVSSFIPDYWLYEPILETSFTPSPISYSLQPSFSVESCSCRTTHAKGFARRKKKRPSSKGQSYFSI